ncbi:lysozyme-like isoform X2 [Macrobrachium rosenbergii]|uniref:lysozyme-like isoform X2 n=1 Tax=Macrobrachium rosenbergii TaxID=79674 RepID=UPI0034D7082A
MHSAIRNVVFIFAIGIGFVLIKAQSKKLITTGCMNCICEAASNCNVSIGCFQPYDGSYFCGAFGISLNYWIDAGKPIIKNDDPEKPGAFENCVTDLYCAAETVHQYMKKFSTDGDCNSDGEIDCADFALMHNMGGYDCSSNVNNTKTDFYVNFESCWAKIKPQPSVNATSE